MGQTSLLTYASAGSNISGRWKAIFTDTVSKKWMRMLACLNKREQADELLPYGDYRYGVVDGDS